jgi:hypothetical protein
MLPLASVIAAEFSDASYRADLASIVGDRSDDALAAWIDALCRERLGQAVVGGRFSCKSVGAVFGLALASGDSVVLKLFHPTFDPAQLDAIDRCLAHIVASGYPAPTPLGGCSRPTA